MNTSVPKKRFVFLILKNFSMLPFSCAIETLRLANRFCGYTIYDWIITAERPTDAIASNGITLALDNTFIETKRNDVIVVCGGYNIKENTSNAALNWLRRESRKGITIGAICTATHVIAKAGLLNGKRGTIHWENLDSFEETFPDVKLQKTVFTIDGNRFTAAGGVSPIDLMLSIISTDIGQEAANWIADQFLYNTARTEKDGQRLSIPTRIGVRHPKLANVIKMMEENIEEPISPSVLAQTVRMSTRQLERLFRRYLDRSPKRYYMELRLQKARNLLMQTDMSVLNVALACGFTSPSHFSKCYRTQYDTTPYRERGIQNTKLTTEKLESI